MVPRGLATPVKDVGGSTTGLGAVDTTAAAQALCINSPLSCCTSTFCNTHHHRQVRPLLQQSSQTGQIAATTHHHRQVRPPLQHITTGRSDHCYNTSSQTGQIPATTHHHRQIRQLLQHFTTDRSDSCYNTPPQTGQTAAKTHHHRQVRQLLQHASPQAGHSAATTQITTDRSDFF